MRKRKTKLAPTGCKEGVNIGSYKTKADALAYLQDLRKVGSDQKKNMLLAGVDPAQKGRSGTYLQMDHSVVHS